MDITYLHQRGSTLASKPLFDSFDSFDAQVQSVFVSDSYPIFLDRSLSALVDPTGRKVLGLFGTDPKYWDVVFTANTTAAVELVAECFAARDRGFDFLYHCNAHASLVRVRE